MIWDMVFHPTVYGATNEEALWLYQSSFDTFQQKAREWTL